MTPLAEYGPVTYLEDSSGTVWADTGDDIFVIDPDEADRLRAVGAI